jgi:nucleotide-binding universal stress UspA family protein
MKPFKVLFATNFKEPTFDFLTTLFDLKKGGLKEIILTHIIPRDDVAYVPFGGYMQDEEERIREEAKIRFEDWQKSISQAGIKSKIHIEVGNPIPKIVEIAETEKVKLIAAGHKKRTTLEKIYIGSHTLELLRWSKIIPILLNKSPIHVDPGGEWILQQNNHPFCRPLLATDWSEISNKSLHFIASFKDAIDRVNVVHVIGVKISKGVNKAELKRLERESKERLETYGRYLENAGIKAETHLMAGRTEEEILRLSCELKSTMIILGTTGKDRIGEFFLGSVSHRIAEISDRPTLLIP